MQALEGDHGRDGSNCKGESGTVTGGNSDTDTAPPSSSAAAMSDCVGMEKSQEHPVSQRNFDNMLSEGEGEELRLEYLLKLLPFRDDNFDLDFGLQQYWAQGRGAPKPFQYHPAAERRFIKREKELQRLERILVARVRKQAERRLADIGPPIAPTKPAMPGIFHFKAFEGTVTLPWSWNHNSGEDFRRAWEETYPTQQFQDRLMGCLWWWTSKKVIP